MTSKSAESLTYCGFEGGGPPRTRTGDLLIKSQVANGVRIGYQPNFLSFLKRFQQGVINELAVVCLLKVSFS